MARLNYGRHLPAFILLFLAKESNYGLMLMNMMDKYLPCNCSDGAAIYRALAELEKSAAVKSFWDTSSPGAAKKYYTITSKGQEQLKQFKIDIELRKRNFEFFLSEYENIKLDQQENEK